MLSGYFPRRFLCLCMVLLAPGVFAQIRDGGIDPWNLGKGDWIYSMTDATNKLGGHVATVTNETSLMLFYKSIGVRYIVIKAATSDQLFNGCYGFPQLTPTLVNIAHTNGILIFGYNRSYGENVAGEIAVVDAILNTGADGFVYDAEAEWESSSPWIGNNGPSKAWQLCSAVRTNWPTKFLAHAPFPIISFHTSFPYKEFGYWCDAVMPQIYHFSSAGLKRSQSAGINWSDVNWFDWQNSLTNLPPTNINGLTVYWTNSIKPLTPINDVYGPRGSSPCEGTTGPVPDKDVMEFIDYLSADPTPQTVGGYKGVSFWRSDLHGPVQFDYIRQGTSGDFPGVVNNIVIDSPNATIVGPWTSVRTFYNGSFFGNGSGTDTNSFGTNYYYRPKGTGLSYMQFRPTIVVPGDYDIFQWHPYVANASSHVPHIVNCSNGTFTVYANQQTNDGNWSLLGRFNFVAGTNGYVRVTDAISEADKLAVVDGIKFMFVPPPSAPAAPTNVTATVITPFRVDLTWSDAATNETGFSIGRGTNAGGPFLTIGTLNVGAASYSDHSAAENTTYYYVVRATNFTGATASSVVIVTTPPVNPQVPQIISQPGNLAVLPGTPVTLNVAASGTPPLRYQWFRDGVPLVNQTNASLDFPTTQFSDAGAYTLRITNSFGVTNSAAIALGVTEAAILGISDFNQTTLPPAATNLISIAAGAWHELGLRADGAVLAWGNNAQGQCGVPSNLVAVAIAAGGHHSLAVRSDLTVSAWGANDYGQISVPPGLSNVVAVAAGNWHSVALRADGLVIAWGDNSFGQLNLPLGMSNIVSVAARGNHSLALNSQGKVFAWGDNMDAHGVFVGESLVPNSVSNAIAVAAGDYHSLAILNSGQILAWGDNSSQQCNAPVGTNDFVAVAGGLAHSVALRQNGQLAGWGANANGQLNFPPGLFNVVDVDAGGQNTLLLNGDNLPGPRLFNAHKEGNRFTLVTPAVLRQTYSLEVKTNDLSTGAWNAVQNFSGNGQVLVITNSASSPAGFYRLKRN